jgi:hypothetical protein
MPQAFRSVLAIVAGYFAIAAVASFGTMIAALVGIFQPGAALPPSYLTANTLYTFAGALLGGYVTAWVARKSPVLHGAVLAALVLIAAILTTRQYTELYPRLYRILLVTLIPLGVVGGALLRVRRTKR